MFSKSSVRTRAAFLALALFAACAPNNPPATATKASPLQRAAVNGGELEYKVVGSGEPVLLIHGAVFADGFEPLLPEPPLSGYRLINYHRRGYSGSTRAQPPFTIPQQAADALALLDRLGVRKAHVVGHSYGGAIGLQLATDHPERVASLILLEPGIFTPSPTTQSLFADVGTSLALHAKGDDRAALRHFSNLIAPGTWEGLATVAGGPAMQDQAVKDAGTFFDVEMPAAAQWQFTFDDVARIRVPVLNVVGSASNAMFKETFAGVRRALPGAEALTIEGAGHELQWSQARAVAEGIAAFLRKHRM